MIMTNGDWSSIAFAAVGLVVLIGPPLLKLASRRRGPPLPPGPTGWPIVGNFFQLPERSMWVWAAKQAEVYGNCMFVRALGKPMLFVNSYTDAHELLEKRSAIYSSREKLVFARELQGWDWYPAFMPYNEELQKCRTCISRYTQPTALPGYVPIQIQELHVLLKNILENPYDYDKHIRRFPGAIILLATYGHQVTSENDALVGLAEAGIQVAVEAERLYMVDFFPWLKYIPEFLPGAGFKKSAREGYEIARGVLTKPYEEAKTRMLEGKGAHCMVSQLLEENTNSDGIIQNEDAIASSAGMMYAAAQDTTTTTIMTALFALTRYPEMQRKAQEELDRVIGKDTLPSLQDRALLPYINAVCMEALRWNAAAPLSVPHASTVDDNYKDYFIPEGTSVYPNVWAMSRNEEDYPNPEEFIPERYLPAEGKTPTLDPTNFVFGFGRRACPGSAFAQATVFLAVSSIFAAFNINKAVDAGGSTLEPKAVYTPTFARIMQRFECSIVPRNPKMAGLIQHLNLNTAQS